MSSEPRNLQASRSDNGGGLTPVRPEEPSLRGGRLDQFRILGPLGRGGMGVVYEAEDTLLHRRVAIKLLPRPAQPGDPALARLLREAQAVARLKHPNVIAIHHIGQHDGGYYLVFELMRGGSLAARVEAGQPLSWSEATRVVAEACRGLGAAHAAGLVHRDVKPANLMCDEAGAVKVTDFGLVCGGDLTATSTGHVTGTPHFMSPEQCRGESADPRSDLYALGATYFTLLTGRPPYVAATAVQILFAHCHAPVPDPRSVVPDLPEGCAAIIQRAMAKEAVERFQTAEEMRAALAALLGAGGNAAPPPVALPSVRALPVSAPRRRKRRLASVLALTALLVGVGAIVLPRTGWIAGRNPDQPGPTEQIPGRPDAAPSPESDAGLTLGAPSPGGTRWAFDQPFDPLIPPRGRVIRLGGKVQAVGFSADGERFGAGVAEPPSEARDHPLGATIWMLHSGKVYHRLWVGKTVQCLAFSEVAKGVFRGGEDGAVVYYCANQTDPAGDYEVGFGAVRSLALPKRDGLLAVGFASGALRGQVHQFLHPQGSNRGRFGENEGLAGVQQVAYAPDGEMFAVAYQDGSLRLWNAHTRGLLKHLPPGIKANPAVAFDPHRPILAVGIGNQVRFWELENWRWSQELQTRSGIQALAYAPNGKYLAVAEAGGDATLWEVASCRCVHVFRGHHGPALAIAFSVDGRTLATGSADGDVRLWNVTHAVPAAVGEGR